MDEAEMLRRLYAEAVAERGADGVMHGQGGTWPHVHPIRPDGTLGPPRTISVIEWLERCFEREKDEQTFAVTKEAA